MQAFKNTIAENLGGPADPHRLAPEGRQFGLDEVPDQTNKVAVITGGSEGIGFACTHTLLRKGIERVYIVSISDEIIKQAIDAFSEAEELPSGAARRIIWKQCDLTDWKKVHQTGKEILSDTDRLDIVINNAAKGIMTYEVDRHGVDTHFSTNHVGHAVLLDVLLPKLAETAARYHTKVRVVSQSSNLAAQAPNDTEFASREEINRDIGAQALYNRSKLANQLHMNYLSRCYGSKHPGVLFNATHPGVVNTRQTNEHIHEPFPILGYGMNLLQPIKKSVFQGCVSTMFAATKTQKSGQYICPPAIVEAGPEKAHDLQMQERLWQLTRQLVKTGADIDLSM